MKTSGAFAPLTTWVAMPSKLSKPMTPGGLQNPQHRSIRSPIPSGSAARTKL